MKTAIFHTTDSSLKSRNGETCEVLGPLNSEEVDKEVGQMYRVRFFCGLEVDVYADELSQSAIDCLLNTLESG